MYMQWLAIYRLPAYLSEQQNIVIYAETHLLKQPTLTKSASSSSSDNRGRLVAPRDDGKSPRGQD